MDALAGLVLAAHRQLHAGDAALTPDHAAGADRGVKNRKLLAGHGFAPSKAFWLSCLSMIFSENRFPLFGIMLVLNRWPQLKLGDCCYPPESREKSGGSTAVPSREIQPCAGQFRDGHGRGSME